MKTLLIFLFISFTIALNAQVKLVSWNIENIGKSKSNKDILFVANTVKDFDIVAIQEVVAGYGGVQSIARLTDELNRKGDKWDYKVSDPTSSSTYKTERYAFLWKTSTVKIIGSPWLEKKYKLEIDREPFYSTFEYKNTQFTLVNFHAITKSKKPETEIKYFKYLPSEYPQLNLIFVGDFNCPESHTVFNPLKNKNYESVLKRQKTTLKKECKSDQCLASEFDNIFYDRSKVVLMNAGKIHFYKKFNSLKDARKISDHLPIWAKIVLN